jgi:hypothetical protein
MSESADEGGGRLAEFEIGIELDPRDHELALAVRDEVTATTSFLRRTVRVEG